MGVRVLQLLRAGHWEHGGSAALRHARAAGDVAEAAPFGRDSVVLRDDRAGGGVVGRDQHRLLHRFRREKPARVRPERAQVVDLGCVRPALRAGHLHGQDRARRRGAQAQAAVHGAGGDARARRARATAAHRLRVRRRAARARGGDVHGRARGQAGERAAG